MEVALLVGKQRLFEPYLSEVLIDCGARRVVVSRRGGDAIIRRVRPRTVLLATDESFVAPFDAIRRTRSQAPEARLVVIAPTSDPAWRAIARAFGADAVLGHDADRAELTAALAA